MNGQSRRVYTFLNKICGDNSGIFEVLGRTKSFNFGPICRVCKATYQEIQSDPFARTCELRSDLTMMNDTLLFMSGNKIPGINEVPVFTSMKYMTSTDQYPPDRLHNMILGVYKDFLEQMLYSFVGSNNVTTLNSSIKKLKLKNGSAMMKSSTQRNQFHAKGIGAHIYDLFLNLPEIMIEMIFEGWTSFRENETPVDGRNRLWREIVSSDFFKAYITLRKLDCYILQPQFNQNDLNEIDSLVIRFFDIRSVVI